MRPAYKGPDHPASEWVDKQREGSRFDGAAPYHRRRGSLEGAASSQQQEGRAYRHKAQSRDNFQSTAPPGNPPTSGAHNAGSVDIAKAFDLAHKPEANPFRIAFGYQMPAARAREVNRARETRKQATAELLGRACTSAKTATDAPEDRRHALASRCKLGRNSSQGSRPSALRCVFSFREGSAGYLRRGCGRYGTAIPETKLRERRDARALHITRAGKTGKQSAVVFVDEAQKERGPAGNAGGNSAAARVARQPDRKRGGYCPQCVKVASVARLAQREKRGKLAKIAQMPRMMPTPQQSHSRPA
eukprot:g4615.t1